MEFSMNDVLRQLIYELTNLPNNNYFSETVINGGPRIAKVLVRLIQAQENMTAAGPQESDLRYVFDALEELEGMSKATCFEWLPDSVGDEIL